MGAVLRINTCTWLLHKHVTTRTCAQMHALGSHVRFCWVSSQTCNFIFLNLGFYICKMGTSHTPSDRFQQSICESTAGSEWI